MVKVKDAEALRAFEGPETRMLVGPVETGVTVEQEIERTRTRMGYADKTCVAYASVEHEKPLKTRRAQYASISGTYWAVLK